MDHRYFRGSTIKEGKCLKDSYITETHFIMGDSSQKLETEQPADSLPDGRVLFPGDLVNLNLFKQAHSQFYHYQCHKMSVGYLSQWMV